MCSVQAIMHILLRPEFFAACHTAALLPVHLIVKLLSLAGEATLLYMHFPASSGSTIVWCVFGMPSH